MPVSLLFYHILNILPITQLIIYINMYIVTIVEPTGVDANIDMIIPDTAPSTDNAAAYIITDLKLFIIRIADNAGNTSNAVISSEPTRFIANTIITAVITAIIRLYKPAFYPIERVKFSSKVTENSLL